MGRPKKDRRYLRRKFRAYVCSVDNPNVAEFARKSSVSRQILYAHFPDLIALVQNKTGRDPQKFRPARRSKPGRGTFSMNEHIKARYASDPAFRLRMSFGALLRYHLKRAGISKNRVPSFEVVGYSVARLREHLEAQFVPGMTWANYGKAWHVDHKVPASWFRADSIDGDEFRRCWSLDNLQPMFARANIQKGNRWAS